MVHWFCNVASQEEGCGFSSSPGLSVSTLHVVPVGIGLKLFVGVSKYGCLSLCVLAPS